MNRLCFPEEFFLFRNEFLWFYKEKKYIKFNYNRIIFHSISFLQTLDPLMICFHLKFLYFLIFFSRIESNARIFHLLNFYTHLIYGMRASMETLIKKFCHKY